MNSRFIDLVKFVRKNSDYYKKLYKNVPIDCADISKYPTINQETFWKANSDNASSVLTDEHKSGIVFKSGGTTGNPKYSYFTAKEWDDFTAVSGRGFVKNGIKPNDRIANLFYAGELYASFIYVTDLIKSADIGVTFPISGQTDMREIVSMLKKLHINVIAGVPTTIMNVISYLENHPNIELNIDLILFGGESFYPDQLKVVKDFFPYAKVNSILYASVDGGELGYFDANNCENQEHRSFDESTILEIIDEDSGEVIEEENIVGKLLVTNLNRRLMPLIRYPVGDMAVWREPKGSINRKFKLMGRSSEGGRVGPATIYINDLIDLFTYFSSEVSILNFQLLVTHDNKKDRALIKVVPKELPSDAVNLSKKILSRLYEQRTMLKDLIQNSIIHSIDLKWCKPEELEKNPRTGKTKHILDKRS
jgi:phenylacetate-CoA ligase